MVSTNPAQAKVRELIKERGQNGWDDAWSATPWDVGKIQPPLRTLLESGRLELPKTGRALVPGCGKGYDAIFIAETLGYDTVAADISPTAVEAAKQHASSSPNGLPSNVSFEVIDFFRYSVSDEERFDLIFDYTFFVAILPSMRNDWGKKMRELVKPGGVLITLIFPIDPPQDVGPPFFVRPEHYLEPLGEGWEKVIDEVPEVSSENHVGRERLVVWRRLG
ncbi:S-adenosyl-L-methionine-dependent methyltransferase [Punctularia strigosozonata HHB-11173 SS5]|uniref:S-adenosyl-L-methionine-dependent methyltransferase n=1 Tax=Punctularia strigosozonata (strain HHB-11173) TaxID=741275 RepID=UPI000441720C|nr:S-adenosyl-L-methionine-dependent methyltransferase [Punctularia strigosozonata HHB-11173 SS5]EIN10667.1 S-adenosyl-L-methionine-dependent methyltransferase [Punctularia strigosozonata HHB-11173 SS5]